MAGATGQSYAATRSCGASIAYRDVALQQMVGAADHDNTGEAVAGHGHARHRDARTVLDLDALAAKLLHYTKAADDDIF